MVDSKSFVHVDKVIRDVYRLLPSKDPVGEFGWRRNFIFPDDECAAYTAPSPLHGTGVFTRRDIKAGEVVTMYPFHAFHDNGVPSRTMAICDDASDDLLRLIRNGDDTYTVPSFCGFKGVGDPKRTSDPWFVGHIVNDAVGFTRAATAEARARQKGIYYRILDSGNNSEFRLIYSDSFDTLGLAVVAMRDIKAGDKITTGYGAEYWLEIHRMAAARTEHTR